MWHDHDIASYVLAYIYLHLAQKKVNKRLNDITFDFRLNQRTTLGLPNLRLSLPIE